MGFQATRGKLDGLNALQEHRSVEQQVVCAGREA